MEKIKTIEEFVADYWNGDENTNERVRKKLAKDVAIDFAKYHVELALRQATEKAMIETDDYGMRHVNDKSIEASYPLSNIK